jgi:competence protein ComGC
METIIYLLVVLLIAIFLFLLFVIVFKKGFKTIQAIFRRKN